MFKQVLFFLLNTVLSIHIFSHISKLFGKTCLNNPFLLVFMTKFSCTAFLSFLPSVYRKLFYSLRFQLHKFIHFHKNILRYVTQVLQPCKLSVNVEIMIFFNSLLKKNYFLISQN